MDSLKQRNHMDALVMVKSFYKATCSDTALYEPSKELTIVKCHI